MKKIIGIFIIALSFISSNINAQVTSSTEMGKVCKIYTGSDGLRVVLCRIGHETKNEMLVGIEGIDHPWSGKIFKAKVAKFDGKMDISIVVEGKPWVLLTYRFDYTLHLSKYGTEEQERVLNYSDSLSADCKPEWLRADYIKQENGGN